MMPQWHHLLALLGSHYSASELVLDVCWVSLWWCPTLNSLVKLISFVAHTHNYRKVIMERTLNIYSVQFLVYS